MHERHGAVQPDDEALPAVLGRYSSLSQRGPRNQGRNSFFNIFHVGQRIAHIIRPVYLGSNGLIGVVGLGYRINYNHQTNHMDAFRSNLP